MRRHHSKKVEKHSVNEDWLAVILAFLIILFAVVGLLGKTGLNITF